MASGGGADSVAPARQGKKRAKSHSADEARPAHSLSARSAGAPPTGIQLHPSSVWSADPDPQYLHGHALL